MGGLSYVDSARKSSPAYGNRKAPRIHIEGIGAQILYNMSFLS